MPRINWTMRNSSYDLTISHWITIAIWEVGWNLNSSWSTTSWHNIHTVDKQILMLIRAGAANWLLLHTNLVGIYNFDYSETGPTTSMWVSSRWCQHMLRRKTGCLIPYSDAGLDWSWYFAPVFIVKHCECTLLMAWSSWMKSLSYHN